MTESPLEGAIFYMIKVYLDSKLVTPEEVRIILERLQEKVAQYDLQYPSTDSDVFIR